MDYYQIVFIVAEIAVWVNQLDSDLGSREESQEAKLESLARCLSYSLKIKLNTLSSIKLDIIMSTKMRA